MKLTTLATATLVTLAGMSSAQAANIQVTITNLTQGMHFTPRLLVAHNSSVDLFTAGTAASTQLAWLAEAGHIGTNSDANTDDFGTYLEDAARAADNKWMQFGGLVNPATVSAVYNFDTENYTHLSLLTMLIPTNDAFAGMDSWEIPTTSGTYTVNINAYDAGTEANDEINPAANNGADGSARTVTEDGTGMALGGYGVPGMAAPAPTQANLQTTSSATGVAIQVSGTNTLADASEGSVHIHRNVVGDANATGGISDLNSSVHRWLNPVARLTVTVQ